MYQYYVSYQHRQGYGNSEIWTNKKIKTCEQIRAIEKNIEEKEGIICVCINNFILLKRKWGKCK